MSGASEGIQSRARLARGLFARAVFLATGVAALCAAPASAASPPPADFSLTFSSTKPSAPTDAMLHIVYKDPQDPGNPYKAPQLTSVTIAAPPGTIFDGAAVPACRASDDELMLEGAAACPQASQVGTGFGTVITGLGPPIDPAESDATLFNAGDAIIELFTFHDTNITAAIDRAKFESSNTMVLRPSEATHGLPLGDREFSFTYHAAQPSAGKAFITTPPICPPTGLWTSQLTWTTSTGVTYSASSTTPCTPAATERPAASSHARPKTADKRRKRASGHKHHHKRSRAHPRSQHRHQLR